MIESQQLDNPAESLDSDCGTEIKVILCLVMLILSFVVKIALFSLSQTTKSHILQIMFLLQLKDGIGRAKTQ